MINITSDKIYRLDKKDRDKAADIIVEAFMEYPLPGQYIDPKRRRKALKEMYRVELNQAIHKGLVFTLGGDFREVSIWKDEIKSASKLSYARYVCFSSIRLAYLVRIGESRKVNSAIKKILDAKVKLNLPKNAVELYILAVHPDNQGQGRVSKLLKPILKQMQEEGRPVLVMTNTESNRALYEYLGFKVVEFLDDKENDVISYFMVK